MWPKKTKKNTIKKNREDGTRKERQMKFTLELERGTKVTRSPKGQDYIETDYDHLGHETHRGKIEVKKGKSRLSSLQKKTRAKAKKNGEAYHVVRFDSVNDNFW